MLDINKEIGSTDEIRRAKDAKEYAEATIEVAKECQVPVLDVWSAFMKQTGWKEEGPLPGSEEAGKSEILADFLYDGKLYCSHWLPSEAFGSTSEWRTMVEVQLMVKRVAPQSQWVQNCLRRSHKTH
jgi:hypothetical protein